MADVRYTSSTTYSQNWDWQNFQAISTVPTVLRPKDTVYSDISTSGMRLRLTANGVFQYQAMSTTSKPTLYCLMIWARV